MTVIYKKVIEDDDYQLLESRFPLSGEAQKLLRENPTKFRDRYGDYFVAGLKNGSSFRGFCTYTAKNRPLMEESKLDIKDKYPFMSSPHWKEFKSEMEKKGVSILFSAAMNGVSKNYPKPIADEDDVKSALEWFSSHAKGSPTLVLLRHYSCLFPALLPCVPVHPDAIIETVEILRDAMYFRHNLKFYENRKFQTKLILFLIDLQTNRLMLCEKPDIRSKFLEKSRMFRVKFFELRAMKVFILKINEEKQYEPKKGRHAGTKAFGAFNLADHRGLVGAKSYDYLTRNPSAEKKFKFSCSNRLVVGWRMEQIGKGSKRKWTTLEDHFLLSSKVEINITGKGQLKLTVIHVSREDYFFYNEKFVN